MEFSEIKFTDELTVTFRDSMGDDFRIVEAARISTQTVVKPDDEKLLRFLLKQKHASPFESCIAQFVIHAPIIVVREHMRHRTQSYNEVSGRYSVLEPLFYIPGSERPLTQVGKPGAYSLVTGTEEQSLLAKTRLEEVAFLAWENYKVLLESGIAKEVARDVLPVNIYTKWYATANLRNWLNYLSLRTDKNAMWEIRQVAFKIEEKLTELFPWTMNAWNDFGREAL